LACRSRPSQHRPTNPNSQPDCCKAGGENPLRWGMSLETLPNRGRPGRITGTRELIFPPYVIVYRINLQTVEILRIYHGAQDWPYLYLNVRALAIKRRGTSNRRQVPFGEAPDAGDRPPRFGKHRHEQMPDVRHPRPNLQFRFASGMAQSLVHPCCVV